MKGNMFARTILGAALCTGLCFSGQAFAATAAAASAAPAAVAAAPKIAVVSLESILRDSAPARAATAKLQKEFDSRTADMESRRKALNEKAEKFSKDSAAMSDTQRLAAQRGLAEEQRALDREQRAYREEFSQRQNEEIQMVIARANQVIQDIARRENIDLILQDPVWASPRIDITDKVLEGLKK